MKKQSPKTQQAKTKKSAKTRKTTVLKSKTLKYTDGKAHEVDERQKLRDLEEILNPGGMFNPFRVNTEEDFDNKVSDMSLPELQSLAVETGVFPSGNKTSLKQKLKKEFKSRVFQGKGRVIQQDKPIVDPNSLTAEQKKLFNVR
ncbi:hypothetical protein OAA62_01120 [bacterium]|nr:hypothetical protein [bacterium]